MEATLLDRTSSPAATPVTVAVGHNSALVSAGLAATLLRMPGHSLRLEQISPASCSSACPPAVEVIFGDSALLKRLQTQQLGPTARAKKKAKFVLVTTADEPNAYASKAAGEIDECLSIECPEEELFATVQRLIDASRPTAWSASRSADRAVPSRMRQHQPATTHLRLAHSANEPELQAATTHLRSIDSAQVPNATTAFAPLLRAEARGGLAPGALRRVREHIDQHCNERISTDHLASVAGLSPGHFNRAFKQSTGSSPHQYVTQKRVAKATELLEKTCRALADIALEVGFADQSHFSRTYVAVTGETPSACRRRHR
jgi:AraC-like DNA-binding protein